MKKIIILAIIALIVTIIPILSYAQTFTSSTTHSFTSSFTYNVWPVSNVPNGYRSNKLTVMYSDGWLFVDADATTFFQVYPYGSGFASVRLRGTDGVDFLSTSTTVVRPEEISANTKCNTKHATYALFYGRAGEYSGDYNTYTFTVNKS